MFRQKIQLVINARRWAESYNSMKTPRRVFKRTEILEEWGPTFDKLVNKLNSKRNKLAK